MADFVARAEPVALLVVSPAVVPLAMLVAAPALANRGGFVDCDALVVAVWM